MTVEQDGNVDKDTMTLDEVLKLLEDEGCITLVEDSTEIEAVLKPHGINLESTMEMDELIADEDNNETD